MRRLNSFPSRHRKSSPGWMMPHLAAMARAVLMLSPVTMRTVMPARWHLRIASGTWKRQERWVWPLRQDTSVSGLSPFLHPDLQYPPPTVVPMKGISREKWLVCSTAWSAVGRVLPSFSQHLSPPLGVSFIVLGPRSSDDSDPGPNATNKAGRRHWNIYAVEGHHWSRVWKGDHRNHPAPSTSFSTVKWRPRAAEPGVALVTRLAGKVAVSVSCGRVRKEPLSPATLPDGKADGGPVPLGP